MPGAERRHLYLPARDRSFWTAEGEQLPLLYLAWGARDFHRQPIPVSRHEGWVCVLIEEGAPTMVVRRQAVRMPAGTLALVGPDCPFGWKGATSGASKFRMWMWRDFTGTMGPADLRASIVSRPLARHERQPFLHLHDLCRREVLRAAGPAGTYLEGCRILFDTTIQRELLDRPAGGEDGSDTVALARSWMRAHLDSHEPIARLCDYLNVSQSTLYRVFAAAEGMSPLSWFHEARMARAHELLVSSALSVKEVAHVLGYEHGNDLSRAFRRRFGETPTTRRARQS
ncbi:AraC family transcriptional regulator [Luteitalea pratensis]|nr:AraC family transcriptional regulator [Luteitalea pratensis]